MPIITPVTNSAPARRVTIRHPLLGARWSPRDLTTAVGSVVRSWPCNSSRRSPHHRIARVAEPLRLCLCFVFLLLPSVLAASQNASDPRLNPANTPGFQGTFSVPDKHKYDYADALHKSLLFYHAQRSGKVDTQRLAWRTDSCFDCKGKFGEDLSSGWFEAANTMKWTQPKAWTVTQLAFNLYIYGDAMASVNEKKEALRILRWGAEYFINAHPQPNVLVGVLGLSELNGTDIDFGYFGPPEEYEQWAPRGVKREAFYVDESNPSTEMAGQAAAALAATSVVWKDEDKAFSELCLRHAKELYNFADKFRGTYKTNQTGFANTRKWYPSSGFLDELAYANIWLHIATKEAGFLDNAKTLLQASYPSEYSWDDVDAACVVLMYRLTGDQVWKDKAGQFFALYLPGGKVKQTPKGLSFFMFWGSLRYAANHAFLSLVHADSLERKNADATGLALSLRKFAVQQINYILGDSGRSWVVGFGDNSPKLPYHKGSYNAYIDYPMRGKDQGSIGQDFLTSPTPNRFVLYGALVGGPRNDDTYLDDRTNYEFTEVTQDYNAGFTGALAALIQYYTVRKADKFEPASDCKLDLGWGHPNAELDKKPNWPKGDCYHTCDPCGEDFQPTPIDPSMKDAIESTQSGGSASTQADPVVISMTLLAVALPVVLYKAQV